MGSRSTISGEDTLELVQENYTSCSVLCDMTTFSFVILRIVCSFERVILSTVHNVNS